MQQCVKFVCRFFTPYFYENRTALLWFVREAPGYGITAFFCQTRHNSANVPYFHSKRLRNPAKGAAIRILGLQHFTRRCTAARPSKCGTFAIKMWCFWWEKAARMLPCFQMPLCHICCILFDTYRTSYCYQLSY